VLLKGRGDVDHAVRNDAGARGLLLAVLSCASLPLPVFPGLLLAVGRCVFFAALFATIYSVSLMLNLKNLPSMGARRGGRPYSQTC